MNKKYILFATIVTFLIASVIHFGYSIFPNPIFAIFFPVNESIWEHMKLIPSALLLYEITENILSCYLKKEFKTSIFLSFISSILGIVFYLCIYLPIHHFFGYHMVIALSVLFFAFFICFVIKQLLVNSITKKLEQLGIVGIILLYIVFGYLTYHPIKIPLFYDSKEQKYGIQIYEL